MSDPLKDIYCAEQIVIPVTFPYMLKFYAKAAIRTQPYDLLRWTAAYFRAMANGETPPVKERLEYPEFSHPSGITPAFLKTLLKRFGRVDKVSLRALLRDWHGIALPESSLYRIFSIGGFLPGEECDFYQFLSVACGFLGNNLLETMIYVCETLTEEPEGGSAMIPLGVFLKLYGYLADLDCSGDRQVGEAEELFCTCQPISTTTSTSVCSTTESWDICYDVDTMMLEKGEREYESTTTDSCDMFKSLEDRSLDDRTELEKREIVRTEVDDEADAMATTLEADAGREDNEIEEKSTERHLIQEERESHVSPDRMDDEDDANARDDTKDLDIVDHRDEAESARVAEDTDTDIVETPKDEVNVADDQRVVDNRVNVAEEKAEVTDRPVDMANDKVDVSEDRVDMVEDRVDVSEDKVEVVEDEMLVVEDRVDTIEDPVFMVEDKLEAAKDRIDTVEDKVDVAEDKVEEAEDGVDTVEDKVEEAEDGVDRVEERADFSDYDSEYDYAEEGGFEMTVAESYEPLGLQDLLDNVCECKDQLPDFTLSVTPPPSTPDSFEEFIDRMRSEVGEGRPKIDYRVAGIGRPVSVNRVTAVGLWLAECARRQNGVVGPRNLKHFLCPVLYDEKNDNDDELSVCV